MSAMSWVLLTHRVVRSDPFHCTVAPWMNWEPFNVNRKLGPFEFTCDGFVDFARGAADWVPAKDRTGLSGRVRGRIHR
jgi:hypothetical protein